mmetsp:Transcript_26904/g.57261  ORF Transcript_26904/g.57261 Transcript_26904/m.57261 type:complete len:203 (-) Transcript_26904:144-752(-)
MAAAAACHWLGVISRQGSISTDTATFPNCKNSCQNDRMSSKRFINLQFSQMYRVAAFEELASLQTRTTKQSSGVRQPPPGETTISARKLIRSSTMSMLVISLASSTKNLTGRYRTRKSSAASLPNRFCRSSTCVCTASSTSAFRINSSMTNWCPMEPPNPSSAPSACGTTTLKALARPNTRRSLWYNTDRASTMIWAPLTRT